MTRSFAIVVGDQVDMAGIQIIGWDPVAKQIRSGCSIPTAASPKASGLAKAIAG